MLERRQPRAHNARLVQDLERALVARDVELVPHAALERPAAVGPDLRRDAEAAQEAERTPGDRRIREIQVNRHLSAAAKVLAARGVEEPRQLGEPVALALRRDRRELVPEVFRQ
jgi:hypothetical protein